MTSKKAKKAAGKVETLTPNPKWHELCSCGAPNHACSCSDNEDLYTCDYCGVAHLIDDTTPTDKDCHACPECFKECGLREWREMIDERGAQWKDPVTGEWSSERPVETCADPGCDKPATGDDGYCDACSCQGDDLDRCPRDDAGEKLHRDQEA